MEPKQLRQVVRLGLFLVAGFAVYWLISSLDVAPAILVSAQPETSLMATADGGQQLTPTATGKAGMMELAVAIAAGFFVVWKYQGSFLALFGKLAATPGPASAAEQLAAMQSSQLPPQVRAHFETLTIQAVYEGDNPSMIKCVKQLNPNFPFKKAVK